MSDHFFVNILEEGGIECMFLIRLTRVLRNDKFPSIGIAGDMLVGGIDSVDFNGLGIVSTKVEGVNYNLFNVSWSPLCGEKLSVAKEFRLVQGKYVQV